MDGLWLSAEDFITDGCGADELGQLGFPRAWPEAYRSFALRELVGRRGRCPASRLAVVEREEQLELSGELLPWQGRVNAAKMALEMGLELVEGWLILERLEAKVPGSFVALRHTWLRRPCGRWLDVSPWPPSWHRVLLAEALEPLPAAVGRRLRAKDWQLAWKLQLEHGQQVSAELAALQLQLAKVLKEAEAEMEKAQSFESLAAPCAVGSLVLLEGHEAVVAERGARARLADGREAAWKELKLLEEAREKPDLTTVGTEIAGSLERPFGVMEYSLWPLIYSGFIRVRCADALLQRLSTQCEALSRARAPSHALFLQGEMKEGEQLTIQEVDPEYEEILLSCAAKLGQALLGEEDAKYVLDSAWSVHQMEGDYNPVHFHNNARSMFGFSSFLHLKLPSVVCRGGDGGTSFVWKTDSMAVEGLECPGLLEVEMEEGYLHVFPQWVQHFVWPFKGPGERRTIAANVARLPR